NWIRVGGDGPGPGAPPGAAARAGHRRPPGARVTVRRMATGGPPPVLRDPAGGALELARLFASVHPAAAPDAAPPAGVAALVEPAAPAAEGELVCGPLAVRIAIERGPAHATWRLRVRNASAAPIALDAVGLGFRWQPPAGAGEGAWRLLRQGFQYWS